METPAIALIVGACLLAGSIIGATVRGLFSWNRNRRLSSKQTRTLIAEFSKVQPGIPRIIFTHFADEESIEYMRDIMAAVRRSGIIASDNGHLNPANSNQQGIILLIPDEYTPTPVSRKITQALNAAKIAHELATLPAGHSELMFFVGPKPYFSHTMKRRIPISAHMEIVAIW